MAANAQPTVRFAETRHHFSTTAALVALSWIATAGTVAAIQTKLQPISPNGAAAATIAAILLAAHGYTRFCARHAGSSHALGVGIAWLVLGITTELAIAAHLGRGWYAILGSPDHPLLRNVFFFVWIFSPVLFAHREDED